MDVTISIADIANIILIAVLVGATIFYAKKTRDMAMEMEKARKVQLLPKLKLSPGSLSPIHTTAELRNVGVGPAFNVQITIAFGNLESRQWTAELMTQLEKEDFLFPDPDKQGMPTTKKALDFFQTIRVTGTYYDVFGELHTIDDSINLEEYLKMLEAARVLYKRDELKEIRKKVENIAKSVEKIAKKP